MGKAMKLAVAVAALSVALSPLHDVSAPGGWSVVAANLVTIFLLSYKFYLVGTHSHRAAGSSMTRNAYRVVGILDGAAAANLPRWAHPLARIAFGAALFGMFAWWTSASMSSSTPVPPDAT